MGGESGTGAVGRPCLDVAEVAWRIRRQITCHRAAFAPAAARPPDHSGLAEIGTLAERLHFALASTWWPLPLLLVAIAVLPLLALWRRQRE